jgi:hypothetical protein
MSDVLIAQSRTELRQSIGWQYGGLETHTATATGSTSTFVDAELDNTDDYINGRYWYGTSGTNSGSQRFVNDYVGSTTTGTLRGDVLGAAVADGDTYELWDRDINPRRVHDAINRAVRSIPRKASPPLRDISLHTSTHTNTLAIPTNTVGLTSVEVRLNNTRRTIENCDSVWTELVDGDVTATADTEMKRQGSASNKFVLAAGIDAGDIIATNSIESTDFSKFTHVEFFIYSTVATSAGDIQLLLDNTAQCASPLETLSVPALTADTWTWVRVALDNPELDTAIISVGLKHTVDIGAATIYLDGIETTVDGSEDWIPIHRNGWKIDRDGRQLILNYNLMPSGGDYALVKLIGVKKPTELTTDSTQCDIEPEYIVHKATAILMRARGDRRDANRDAAFLEADRYEALALDALSRQQISGSVRWVD